MHGGATAAGCVPDHAGPATIGGTFGRRVAGRTAGNRPRLARFLLELGHAMPRAGELRLDSESAVAQALRRMVARLRQACLVLLVSAVALSGLGMSITIYACSMQMKASVHPCCAQPEHDPAGARLQRVPCCSVTHRDVAAAPSETQAVQNQIRTPVAAPAAIALAVWPVAEAPVLPGSITTHGPPPLQRGTRLLI